MNHYNNNSNYSPNSHLPKYAPINPQRFVSQIQQQSGSPQTSSSLKMQSSQNQNFSLSAPDSCHLEQAPPAISSLDNCPGEIICGGFGLRESEPEIDDHEESCQDISWKRESREERIIKDQEAVDYQLEGGDSDLFLERSTKREKKQDFDAFEFNDRADRPNPSQLSSHIEHPMSSIIDSQKSSNFQNYLELGNQTNRSSLKHRQEDGDVTVNQDRHSKIDSESKTGEKQQQLTELQKQKEALKQYILGVRPDSGTGPTRKKKERELKQISHFLIDKTLGEGTFGKVKLGIHSITQEKVAIKILEKNKIQDQTDIDRIAREIKILKQIRHPRVIQLYQILETDCELYLIMEHANAGELFDYIVRYDRVDDVNAARFFDQIMQGVFHLHQLGICHRDLKPENLLLERIKNDIKIIDFGLSNMYLSAQDTLKTACGSPCYAAPEMIAGKDYKGLQVDIWSCGVILYAMLCGYLPFEDPNTDKLYKKILDCDYSIPNYVSETGRNLIQKILNTNPEERYTIQQIRNHPWFVKNLEKAKKNEPESSQLQSIDIYQMSNLQLNSLSMTTNNIHQNTKNQANKEIKINRQIVQDIVEKYRIPLNPTKRQAQHQDSNANLDDESQYQKFTVETVVKSLAYNKHNDSTTTYYLLHKKWIMDIEDKFNNCGQASGSKSSRLSQTQKASQSPSGNLGQLHQKSKLKSQILCEAQNLLLTLSTSNCEQVIYKIKHQIENKNNGSSRSPTQRTKNMLNIKDDRQKLIDSASLVIKSPAGPALGKSTGKEQHQVTGGAVNQVKDQVTRGDVRGTKRIQINSNNEIEIKSTGKHQTFSLTSSNVKTASNTNKNNHYLPSEPSSRERRHKIDKNIKKIDLQLKKQEFLQTNTNEIKMRTNRRNDQNNSLTPGITISQAQKIGGIAITTTTTMTAPIGNDEGATNRQQQNSNSHLDQSKVSTNNQNFDSSHKNDQASQLAVPDTIIMNTSKISHHKKIAFQHNSATHSKKQSAVSQSKAGNVAGIRDNSEHSTDIVERQGRDSKIQSFKQYNISTSKHYSNNTQNDPKTLNNQFVPNDPRKSMRKQNALKLQVSGETSGTLIAQKIPVFDKTLGTTAGNKRYKSQQRGAKEQYNFRSGVNGPSRLNNYKRERSNENNRHSSRGFSAVSRVSKMSGTNVSYQSNLSVIRQNIHRFKYNKNSSSKKKDDRNGNLGSINIVKNTVSSFMGVQIPRKNIQNTSGTAAITKVSKGTDGLKKTARISIQTKESTNQNQPSAPKTVTKTKELTLNMAKVQTPMSGTKYGFRNNFNNTSNGKSPVKNYGNVTTRNQHINKFNTSTNMMMVGNSHVASGSHSQNRQTLSKKQQNINQLIGYGSKVTRTFNQKNSISDPKQQQMLVSDKQLRLDMLETYNNQAGPKSKQLIKTGMGSLVQSTKAGNHTRIEFLNKKKTVNIDLDASNHERDDRTSGGLMMNVVGGGPYQPPAGFSQTPMAGNSKPFSFNESQINTSTANQKQEKRKHSITVENPNKQGCPADINSESPSNDDNFLSNRQKTNSQMPNEYTSVTQSYKGQLYCTQQKAISGFHHDKGESQHQKQSTRDEYQGKKLLKFNQRSYRRSSFMVTPGALQMKKSNNPSNSRACNDVSGKQVVSLKTQRKISQSRGSHPNHHIQISVASFKSKPQVSSKQSNWAEHDGNGEDLPNKKEVVERAADQEREGDPDSKLLVAKQETEKEMEGA